MQHTSASLRSGGPASPVDPSTKPLHMRQIEAHEEIKRYQATGRPLTQEVLDAITSKHQIERLTLTFVHPKRYLGNLPPA